MAAKKRVYYKSIAKAIVDISEKRSKHSLLSKILFYGLIILAVMFVAVAPSYIVSYFNCSTTLACIPSFIVLGVVFFGANFRKRRTLSKFMKVSDITGKVNYIELGENTTLQDFKVLYENDTWVFGSRKEDIIPFIYNWFLTAGVIDSSTTFNVYTLKTEVLNKKFNRQTLNKTLENQAAEVCLVPITEFEFSDEQLDLIIDEAQCVRPYQFETWLSKNYVVPAFFNSDDAAEVADSEVPEEKVAGADVADSEVEAVPGAEVADSEVAAVPGASEASETSEGETASDAADTEASSSEPSEIL